MSESIAAGWNALSRGAWAEALTLLDDCGDHPEALEAAGIAHWWLDDADATLAARERSYRLYRERGDALGAARVASALAWDCVLFDGRTAVARGWLDRAARLLADEPTAAEHGWHAVREAEVGLASRVPEQAWAAAERAVTIGAQLSLDDLQIVGRSLQGLALVHEGRVEEGMRQLDESAAAATAGDLTDLMWVGKVCCNLIAACAQVGDVERATQWCAEVKEFARRWGLQALFNTCRTQYAAILLRTGAWAEAETELRTALAAFSGGRRAALVDGTASLGELRRRQGRRDEARRLFVQSERSWTSKTGSVELALDEGDAATALTLAERLGRATAGTSALDRIASLSLLVRAAVAADRIDAATDAVIELDQLADEIGTTGARAVAAHAGGECARASGDLVLARQKLEDAVDLFGLCDAPYERARARLTLGHVLLDLGEPKPAHAETEAARASLVTLGIPRSEMAAIDRLPDAGASPLTRREHEVLVQVAAGRSNREIASQLVVSEHTVHRHVANILRKLDAPTRAAAVARAMHDGLV